MYTILFTVAAYLIGSISFAVVASHMFGLADPRTYGSKNPGATNVLRSGSKKAAIATLVRSRLYPVAAELDEVNLPDTVASPVAKTLKSQHSVEITAITEVV